MAPRLVQLLGEWSAAPPDAGGLDVAERLSLWVNAFEAIRLQSAHQGIQAIRTAAPAPATRALRSPAPDALLARVRHALAQAIEAAVPASDAAFAPCEERRQQLQRQMEQAIRRLREQLRDTLASRSAPLRQLAALDATLEPLLAPREQALLAGLATPLKRRFEERAAAGEPDGFADDWRQALLAELELRLEPVAGLVEALQTESTNGT